jgi:hypothetical protein
MKSNVMMPLTLIVLVLILSGVANAQKADKRVDEIRKLHDETNQRISDAEKQEQSDIFVAEVNVNKRLNPYPAVGIYASAAKFYYTYGDRERNPYPHRLLKIDVVVKRSATTTNAEFLYDVAGDLIFANVRTDGDQPRETRAFFGRRQLIKMIDNDQDVNIKLRAVLETSEALKAESARLNGLFKASLAEGL